MIKSDFLLSVIVPAFDEEENISFFLKRALPVLKKYDYELIFVDDGSSDKTAEKIKAYAKKNARIKLIRFSRNFGHQMALTAGYRHAKGDAVITIDADLQDPPELIEDMVSKWQKGYEVVYAKRRTREESLFKRLTAFLFYRFINLLSDVPIPTDVGDYRLLDRKVVDVLNRLPEHSRFLRGLTSWVGFKQAFVYFDRNKRQYGQTHYPLSKMISFAVEGLTSFSTKPLTYITYLGLLTSMIGFLGIIYALYRRLFLPPEYYITGWTAIFVAVLFIGGVQMIMLGIMGEYLGRIYREVQNRPHFVIKEKINI
ncbi:MAG: glycosyltransferase family 2 protein [bacterium]|nr:glycosyltransferase family 2 protein [bacterium]